MKKIEKLVKQDEWTQKELLENIEILKHNSIEVVIVDTILKPLINIKTITYNPYILQEYKKGTVFVFYCDTGKSTKERLKFYREKFKDYYCISLRGGRGYWRPNLSIKKETI